MEIAFVVLAILQNHEVAVCGDGRGVVRHVVDRIKRVDGPRVRRNGQEIRRFAVRRPVRIDGIAVPATEIANRMRRPRDAGRPSPIVGTG